MKLYSLENLNTRRLLLAVMLLAISFFLLAACTSTRVTGTAITDETELVQIDPYENFNRNIHEFNNKVDDYIANPITKAYRFATPKFMQTGVSNFFANLNNVGVIFNDFLQGKIQQGAEDTGRFLINSMVGVFGLFDVASHVGLPQNQEDFGQTLAVWGVPIGPYLVIPLLGPTTFRGISGATIDVITNPVTYTGISIPALQITSMINSRATADSSLQFIDESALDSYVFTREAYLQWRNYQAADGAIDDTEYPFTDDEYIIDTEPDFDDNQ